MKKYVEFIHNNKLGNIYTNKMFKDITTIKIGGKIGLLYYPNTIDNFIIFYKYYLENKDCELIIIGNGSNILASSNDYIGIVVSFKKIKHKYSLCNNIITVNSGVILMDCINYLKKRNLGGLEYLSLIPGTIGGMVKMNAGAYNSYISDRLIEIKCIDSKGNIINYKKDELIFSYRRSNIDDDLIILECTFELKEIDEKEINNTIQRIKKNRIENQPLDEYNAGSTFKNIKQIPSWKLIDGVGMRGYSIGEAYISSKHCNFLINKKNCNGEDMLMLVNKVKEKVKEKYNIELECEWIFINF